MYDYIASNNLFIDYFKLSVSTIFLIGRIANFTFYVFFFNYYNIFLLTYWLPPDELTHDDIDDWVVIFRWDIIFVVKFIVYFECCYNNFLNYNLFNVTCDSFSLIDIDKYRLNVNINNDDIIIPDIAAGN